MENLDAVALVVVAIGAVALAAYGLMRERRDRQTEPRGRHHRPHEEKPARKAG